MGGSTKCGGRKSYAEARPEMVELTRRCAAPIQIVGRSRWSQRLLQVIG
jgi:hypothetical protein